MILIQALLLFLIYFSSQTIFGTELTKTDKVENKYDIKSVLSLRFNQLKNDPACQDVLFNYSERSLTRMMIIATNVKSKIDCLIVLSLKSKDKKKFIDTVCAKCESKQYDSVNFMRDMARARVSLYKKDQIPKAIFLVKKYAYCFGFTPIKVILPRRPLKVEASTVLYGYPRWHLILEDQNGFRVEWQFETRWTSKLCETVGEIVPVGIPLPNGFRNDLPDVVYRLFFRIVKNANKDADIAQIIDKIHLNEYLFYHDKIIAIAHELSAIYTEGDLVKDLNNLHSMASEIIEFFIRIKGVDFLKEQLE